MLYEVITENLRDRPIYHKDLLPVVYVVGDQAGPIDSPLYGMFEARVITSYSIHYTKLYEQPRR